MIDEVAVVADVTGRKLVAAVRAGAVEPPPNENGDDVVLVVGGFVDDPKLNIFLKRSNINSI